MSEYPSSKDVEAIEKWDYGDLLGCLDFIESIWSDYGRIERRGKHKVWVRFITGGWSGNEEILSAMDKNVGIMTCWEASYRGGKHIYKFRNIK